MEDQGIFNVLIGAIMTGMGYFIKHLHARTERNTEDLAKYKEHIAVNYPTNENIDRRFDKLEVKFDRLVEKIDSALAAVGRRHGDN